MNEKTRNALRNLQNDLSVTEDIDPEGDTLVTSREDLNRVLRWAQNSAHVWFFGDRVEWSGASVPYNFITKGIRGTVVEEDSEENGIAMVQWDGAPVQYDRVKMFHNEIKLAKD